MAINIYKFRMFVENWILDNVSGGLAIIKIGTRESMETLISPNKRHNQHILATTFRKALYSSSTEDKDMVGCFKFFQEMGDPPRVI